MKIFVQEKAIAKTEMQAAPQKPQKRIGAWGTVTDVNSHLHTVTVRLASGVLLENVPVACTNEWVCEYKDEKYVSGMRNLPPEGARVFLLMPTGTFEGAFVLCSGLSRYEKAHEKAFMAGESDRDEKNTVREKVLPGKWKSRYDYKKGSYTLISPKERIKVEVCDDTDTQEVNISAFTAEMKIDKDGNINVTGNTISINGKSPKAAREGDTVKVRIPAGSVVVAVTGQAAGTMNPAPIECTGTITSGSSSVRIGD